MSRIHSLLAIGALAALATAQSTIVVPNGTATTEGNSSNAFPWGRGSAASLQIQTIYDAVNFTGQSINSPIRITRLRWRLNGNASYANTLAYTQATIEMATAAVTSTTASTTFASNVAPDNMQVYSGPVTLQAATASTPGAWFVDVPLANPFLYDPSSGNGLVIYSDLPPGVGTGVTSAQLDVQSTGSNACRVFNSTAYGSGTGTITTNHGVVVEIEYTPAMGLFAGFSANVTTGPSPLQVQFSDGSFSSAPGGVTSWAWDFDGDTVVDSTLQNPTHTYTSCGSYTVSLTVNDGTNPPSTLTRTNYIVTDVTEASFTYQVIVPGTVQFTDTSSPAATAWAWDFDGDSIIDSTAQNPVHVYPPNTPSANVSLTASRLCGPNSTATQSIIPDFALQTTLDGGNGLSGAGAGNVFDLTVTNPLGITITQILMSPWATATTAGPVTCNIWMTDAPGGYAANHTNAAVWRLVAVGSGVAQVSSSTAPVPIPMTLNQRFYIAPGSYSMAIHMNECGVVYTTGNGSNQNFANADLSISAGLGKSAAFNASANNPRVWNGALYYDLCSVGGLSGYGFLAQGCANSLGTSKLTPQSLPTVGSTLTVTVDNLPANVAFMLLGFSNTNSAFGPLPLDLTLAGAPGCFLNVSDNATSLLIGASNSANWSLSIPNNPAFLCTRLFNQALVLDPGLNALGGATSDAAAMIVGN